MSYMSQANDPRRKATAILAVGAIHAVIAVGIITGLTVTGVIRERDGPIGAVTFPTPLPSPLPPEPKPDQKTETDPVPTPNPTTTIGLTPLPPIGPIIDDFGPVTGGDIGPIGPITPPVPPTPPLPPPPTPSASFTPKGAAPANGPVGWISNDDYPANELRRGIEGTSIYRLVIGSNGRVNACEITTTSGSARLDDAACRLITRRARFNSAMDGSGASIVGTYTGSVTWQIPD